MTAYDELMAKSREYYLLQSVISNIGWDTETYIPPKAYPQRGEQMALLYQLAHRMGSDPKVGKLLDKVEKKTEFNKLDAIQQRNVHLIRREYDSVVKIPEKLMGEIAKQQTIAVSVWKKAKAKKDWKLFEPELAKMVDLVQQRGEILKDVRNTPTVYDALLDQFEPKMTQDIISEVFTDVRNAVIPLVDKYTAAIKGKDFSFLNRKVPIPIQRKISTALADFVLYDTTSDQAGGRIDEVEHPFTTGYYDDVRITTHYYEDKIASSIYSVLHEAGHALYGQNYPAEGKWQPWGESSSYGIHESQSRFIENMVGRSPEFVQYFYPILNKLTNNTFKDISLEQFTQGINRVERSKIRIEADEVTYSLHVIIRFEIERELFAGKIAIQDLPNVWNQKYDEYLGVKIKHDSEGVMQDTHWASGYHGYFPSYALGNIYGGQFLAMMVKDIPDWLAQIAKGKFKNILQWMIDHVHRKGNMYYPQDLVKQVTGEGLNAKPFIKYLETKYKRIFGI